MARKDPMLEALKSYLNFFPTSLYDNYAAIPSEILSHFHHKFYFRSSTFPEDFPNEISVS